ncbi:MULTISPECIES: type IV toxin-antitoxin system AbiEi family antitoxin domain-containing protein [Gulosibacter]|uniref:type IV toxin-antitoxin system AbiEi family antitoxin domain-containing protein n=1 Tax=Gulosibacter TaxID=256818 RepID=UPI0013DDD53D|nr:MULTISPECIES: type IV toxin-antitoxin system AbiEi family antitoxin domain-containing protein [Gulosibacter]
MLDLTPLFAANFGVLSNAQLRAVPLDKVEVRQLTRSGQLTQLRRGWWSGTDPHADVVSAVKAGGVLTGPSALKLHGAWTPEGLGVNVRAARDDRIKVTTDLTTHRLRGEAARPCDTACDSALVALFVTMLDFPADTATVLADSLVQQGILSEAQIERAALLTGPRGQEVLARFDASAESGTETLVRLWLRSHHIRYRTQVEIGEVGRVDFLVGKSLIIEVDSKSHHTSEEAYQNDRTRDLALTSLGYRVIRVTYEDVVSRLDEVGQSILSLVRDGVHRRGPNSGEGTEAA